MRMLRWACDSRICRACATIPLVVLGLCLASPATSSAQAVASDVLSGTLSPPAAPFTIDPLAPMATPELAFAARRRRPRPWFAFPPSTFVAPENVFGARLVGMVLDLNASDQPAYRCSGTVVDSPNGSIVWTAGHCIFNRELSPEPFPHIVFVPGAEPGSSLFAPTAPYGVWTAVAYAMTADWVRHGSARHFRRDLGALLIAPNGQGETISQALGGADRISFRGTIPPRAEVLGYPGLGRFSGNDALIGCGPHPTGRFRFWGGPGPEPLAISCGMTLGSSGGPWLTHVNAAGIGTVVSVTSSTNRPSTQLYGAVQTAVARRVWATLARRQVP